MFGDHCACPLLQIIVRDHCSRSLSTSIVRDHLCRSLLPFIVHVQSRKPKCAGNEGGHGWRPHGSRGVWVPVGFHKSRIWNANLAMPEFHASKHPSVPMRRFHLATRCDCGSKLNVTVMLLRCYLDATGVQLRRTFGGPWAVQSRYCSGLDLF